MHMHCLTQLRLPRSREKGQKCVQLDTALAVWQLLFRQMQWPLGADWIDFVQKKHGRAISRDTWVQLLDFAKVRPQQECQKSALHDVSAAKAATTHCCLVLMALA